MGGQVVFAGACRSRRPCASFLRVSGSAHQQRLDVLVMGVAVHHQQVIAESFILVGSRGAMRIGARGSRSSLHKQTVVAQAMRLHLVLGSEDALPARGHSQYGPIAPSVPRKVRLRRVLTKIASCSSRAKVPKKNRREKKWGKSPIQRKKEGSLPPPSPPPFFYFFMPRAKPLCES